MADIQALPFPGQDPKLLLTQHQQFLAAIAVQIMDEDTVRLLVGLRALEIIGNWVIDCTNGDELLEKLRTI